MNKRIPIHKLGALHLAKAYRAGTLSPIDVVGNVFARAHVIDTQLNVFSTFDESISLRLAEESTTRWQRGIPLGSLDGVPVSIKDLIDARGFPTRCGSRTRATESATLDAPPVARLRETGAIPFAKTHTSEFGWKAMTDSPLHGYTRNPWYPKCTPGGSSGGAAVAVACGLGPAAHGTDAAGSIRIPASYCGLYGIKPTTGRVPQLTSCSPFALMSSQGALARSVADAARMLTFMARPDSRDWQALPDEGRDFESDLDEGIAGWRIAYCPELGGIRAEPAIEDVIAGTATAFETLGAVVETVESPFESLEPGLDAYWKAGFAYLLRGCSAEERASMDPRLVELAREGETTSLDDYYRGFAIRAELGRRLSEFHDRYDLLITPTTPTRPPSIDTVYHSPEFDRWRHAIPYTMPFNLTGQPAASIQAGLTSDGLPVGLQIVGPRHAESRVLRASRAFEKHRPFKQTHPFFEAVPICDYRPDE